MLDVYNRCLVFTRNLKTQSHKVLRWHLNYCGGMLTPVSLFLALLITPSVILIALNSEFKILASSQDYGRQDTLEALKQEWVSMVRKENFPHQLSFTMLQPYLPRGTQMTSGYRSAQEQLDLIRRLARAHNIATPTNMEVSDRNSWWQTLLAVRDKGYIVAAPTTTPHSTEEIVFDMSGSDLSAIEEGCRRAERDGIVQFRKIIRETQNNAVHVEI